MSSTTADVYSTGLSEEVFGQAIRGKRDDLLISTKATFRFGKGPNDIGSSATISSRACEGSLKRWHGSYRIYHMHGFDALDAGWRRRCTRWIRWCASGKVRYYRLLEFLGLAL